MDELWDQDPDLPRPRRWRNADAAGPIWTGTIRLDPPPAAAAMMIATRPQDWAEPVRTLLFGQTPLLTHD